MVADVAGATWIPKEDSEIVEKVFIRVCPTVNALAASYEQCSLYNQYCHSGLSLFTGPISSTLSRTVASSATVEVPNTLASFLIACATTLSGSSSTRRHDHVETV